MVKTVGSLANYPARSAFIWFIGLIATGTAILHFPICGNPDRPAVSLLDSMFTITSACCVTGLTVRSTVDDFSFFGQLVILIWIQLGGVGIITVTTFITLTLGGRGSMRQRATMAQTIGASGSDLKGVLSVIFRYTFLMESIGFASLFARNLAMNQGQTVSSAAWEALFHSVSAFCNAGFSLFNNNLISYQQDLIYNLTIMFLIVTGGLGFPVVFDLWRQRKLGLRGGWQHLSLHSKFMLIGTASLITLGTLGILALEWSSSLKALSPGRKILAAMFQAVTPRTAGFNTVDLSLFSNATLFLIFGLMLVGAGPCSAAGGFKVSTLMVLLCSTWSRFRGLSRVRAFRRTIPPELVASAMGTALIYGVVTGIASIALSVSERNNVIHEHFLTVIFESASALGTVGLSVNFTPLTNDFSRVILIVLMFVGRLGPISVFAALSRGERKSIVEYPSEGVLVG